MDLIFFLIPLFGAFIGSFSIWILLRLLFHPQKKVKILGLSLQGIFPKNQNEIANQAGKIAAEYFFSFDLIEQKISDPAILQKILPVIDAHIDDFLKNKLKESLPVVGMFIGDKTIAQLKTVFMEELQSLFPMLMKSYAAELKTGIDIEKMITAKVSGLPAVTAEIFFYENCSAGIKKVLLSGGIIGFVIGIAEMLLLMFV